MTGGGVGGRREGEGEGEGVCRLNTNAPPNFLPRLPTEEEVAGWLVGGSVPPPPPTSTYLYKVHRWILPTRADYRDSQ